MKQNLFILLLVCCFLPGHAQTARESKWRLNLSGGMGYRVVDTSEDESKLVDMGFNTQKIKDCYNDLKWGVQGNSDIHYLFHPNFGIGIKYAFFYTDGKFDESYTFPLASGYGSIALKMKEKDYLNYIGPSLHARSFLEKSKFAVSATLSGGYAQYKSDSEATLSTKEAYIFSEGMLEEINRIRLSANQELFIIRGNSFGMYAGAGLEYFFNKQLALGFDFGYFYSSMNDVTLTTKMDNNTTISQKVKLKNINGKAENLSRIDFLLGIKIYL